jgi:adenylate cyclase
MTAYEQVLRAKRYFWNPTESAHAEARSLLENAVRLDPNYARAHATLAIIYSEEIFNRFNVRPDSLDRLGRAARRAVALDPTDALAHEALANYYFYNKQPELFEMEAAKCLSLNPNYADGLVWLSHSRGILFGRERLIEAEADIRRGMRLDPNHPGSYYEALARLLFFAGRYEEALAAVNKSIQSDDYMWTPYWTALIQAQLGNLDAARAAGSRFLQLRPGSTMASVIQDFSIHESYWDTYFEAAPKAGIPLGDVGALEVAGLKKAKTQLDESR